MGIRVDDASARGKGVASTTLTTAGAVQTLDVVLFPQGSVVVTVRDAGGAVVPNANVYLNVSNGVVADGIYARAGLNGVAVIDHVLAGIFEVRVDNGVLKGVALNRRLAAGETQQLNVQLQPTGGIAGLVAEPDGLTPATGGRVDIRSGDVYVGSAPIGEDGRYHFDVLLLDPFGYELNVYDAAGRFRAFAKRVPVTRNAEVVTKDFTFVGLGQVRGQVKHAATGATAADFTVTVQTRNPDFTAARSARTNAAGFYEINDVPVGPFTASTGNLAEQLWGEADGTLAHAGDIAEINILLQNNAIALPATRSDANNFAFDVQGDGTVAFGSSAFSGALALDVVANGVTHRFTGGEVPTVEQNGREIVTRQNGVAGLNVTRKLFVPLTGYFGRALEFFSNPTAAPITIDVQITSGVGNGLAVTSTSSGDGIVNVADAANPDRWVALDDTLDADPAIAGGRPAAGFVFDGAGAPARAASATFGNSNPARLQLGWTQITVPPGGAVALLHFVVQQTTRAATAASVDRLVRLAPEALEGMTPDEIAAVVNFAVPADGHSVVEPLPALTGTVTGHVFEADGSTPAPFTQVSFRSDTPVFGRTYQASADAGGAFTFAPAAEDGASRVVPIDGFTLSAQHPVTHVASAPVHGVFEPARTLAQIDVVFNNTGTLSGIVLRHTGAAVTNGTVHVSATLNGPAIAVASIGGDARYRVSGLLPGTYSLRASVPHPQGSALIGVASVTIQAGQSAIADLTIQSTGTITGTLSTANGTPVAGVVIGLGNSTGTVSREARTDTGGAFALTDVPDGAVTLSATDPATGIRMTAPAAVAVDTTTTVALKFPAAARLEVQVNFQRGVAAALAPVQLQEAVRGPGFRNLGQTDAGGHLTFNGVSAGAFVVRATHPANARIVASVAGTVTGDGSVVPITIVLPAAGTVRGVVTDAQGPVAGIAVTVRSANASFGGFQTATTDTAGAYAVAGVPDGPFTATVQEFGRQLFGETNGRVDADGQDVVANLSLINNAVSLPVDRYDANGLQYQVEQNGRISASTNYTFGYYWNGGTGASRLEIVSNGTTTPFTGASVGTMEQDGREIVVRQAAVAGLTVTRKVFVPRDGYFARYLELLTNPTSAPITVDLRVRSTVADGSYYPRAIGPTSNGDTTLDVSDPSSPDRWVTFDDVEHRDPFITGGPVPTAFVFDGAGAALRVASATASASQEVALAYEWQNLTVPAGQTIGVMHYVVEQVTAAGAVAAATRLSEAPPEALDGLSPEEIGAIQNFALPLDGLSTVAPLPSLAGMVTGRVLGSDGTTPVPGTPVTFKSLHPLFGRVWELQATDASGTFAIKSYVDDYNHRSVPVAPFTLHARHPGTSVQIDQAGDFVGTFTGNLAAIGQATASSSYASFYGPQNAIDGNPDSFWYTETPGETHWLDVAFAGDVTVSRVVMSTANLLSARVDLIDAAGQIVASANVDASSGTAEVAIEGQGIRRVRITDEANSFWIMIRELQIFGSANATAGIAQQDVVFTNTGTVAVTVRRFNGAPVATGFVTLRDSSFSVNMSTAVDASGVATFTGLPAGSYALSVTSGTLTGSGTVTVTTGSTTAVDVRLSATGTIRGTVSRANGTPSVGSTVRLRGLSPTFFQMFTSTDGAGQYAFADLPLGFFEVIAFEPNTGYPSQANPTLATAEEVITQDFTLIGLGSVTVHARYANGAPVTGMYVTFTPPWGGAFNASATDANGDLTINNIVPGPFSVRLTHPQNGSVFADASGSIAGDGDAQSVTITLPPVGSFSGTVTRPDGTPVPFPDVVVQAPGLEWGPSATDAAGHFTFTAMPAGQPLTVRAYWGSPYPFRTFYGETPFTLAGDGVPSTINVRLPGFAKIAVHVTRDDGVTPWAGAVIYSSDKFRPFYQARGTTDANGNLTLQRRFNDVTPDDFPEGDIALRIYDPNTGAALVDAIAPIRFADVNGTVSVRIDARFVAGNVTGRVYVADGVTPIKSVNVLLLNALDLKQMRSVFTAADGSYSFNNIQPGQGGFIVRAYTPDFSVYVDRAGTFATAGETQQIDVVLPLTSATISGHVFAGDGQTPISSGYAQLSDGQGNFIRFVNVDATGGYNFGTRFFTSRDFQIEAYDYSSGVLRRVTGTLPPGGGPVTVDITLPLSIVRGRVTFADGLPVRFPSVIVIDVDGEAHYANTTVNGDYVALGVPPGTVMVTAQDESSGLNTTVSSTLVSDSTPLILDVQLPPSGTVTGTITGVDGRGMPNTWVSLVSANLEFLRNAISDATGQFTFTRVPAGSVYIQAAFNDGTADRFVGASGTVVAGETLTLPLAATEAGTVSGMVTASDGGPANTPVVILRAFGGHGPNGMYVANVGTGSYTFAGVPAGAVQLVAFDSTAGTAAVADGAVTSGGALTLNAILGNGTALPSNLDGSDGFRYDVSPDGRLESGGTADRRLRDAYSGADRLQVNGLEFPALDAARAGAGGRELTLGPVPMPVVQVTRRVFVPQGGGFARYLETFTNTTSVPQTITVSIAGYSGSNPRIVVAPSTTDNTFIVNEFPFCDCDTPTQGRVFQGSGERPLSLSTLVARRDYFAFTYELTLAPGATVTLMHFEVQRDMQDGAGAEAQARALADLTDPRALDGMSDVDRARVVNFVIPR